MNFIPLTFYSLSFFMIGAYAIIIFKSIRGIKKVSTNTPAEASDISIDVIIAYKNEIDNIPYLIKSLQGQTYSNFRIIWVNDRSNDGSLEYLEKNCTQLNTLLTFNPLNGKKNAVNHGIKLSVAELVLFTDADCTLHPKWIENYASAFIQKGNGLFFGPIVYRTNSLLENIFSIDFLSLMGIGIGLAGSGNPVYMNGANYAISKNFLEAHKEKAGMKYASGDDVFLLHHLKKTSGSQIHPLINKEALVKTKSPETIGQFLMQRIRWGGKTTGYKDRQTIALATIVFTIALLQITSLLLISMSTLVLSIWGIKIALDFIALATFRKIWKQHQFLASFLILAPFYPFYIVYTALAGLFVKKSKW